MKNTNTPMHCDLCKQKKYTEIKLLKEDTKRTPLCKSHYIAAIDHFTQTKNIFD